MPDENPSLEKICKSADMLFQASISGEKYCLLGTTRVECKQCGVYNIKVQLYECLNKNTIKQKRITNETESSM